MLNHPSLKGLPAGLSQAGFLTGLERRFIQQQQSRAFKSSSGPGSAKGAVDAEAFSDWRLIKEACCNWRVWYVSVMVRIIRRQ